MDSGGGVETVIERGLGVVTIWLLGSDESRTVGVKLNVFACVGVPEITPETGSSESPGGRVPEAIVHLNGWTPPVVLMRVLYMELSVAGLRAPEDVMESVGAGLIEIENCGEITGVGVVTLSATCTVKSAGFGPGPGPVGLPTIDPV